MPWALNNKISVAQICASGLYNICRVDVLFIDISRRHIATKMKTVSGSI